MATAVADPQQQQQQQQNETKDDSDKDRTRVWDLLRAAGVPERVLQQHADQLPVWSTIAQQYGEHPVLLLDKTACTAYRAAVPPEHRMLGAAGMFSTGTNLATQLLKHNCYIPERLALYGVDATKEQLGMRWQVREYNSIFIVFKKSEACCRVL